MAKRGDLPLLPGCLQLLVADALRAPVDLLVAAGDRLLQFTDAPLARREIGRKAIGMLSSARSGCPGFRRICHSPLDLRRRLLLGSVQRNVPEIGDQAANGSRQPAGMGSNSRRWSRGVQVQR